MTDDTNKKFNMFKKVIIWGYDNNSHTHHYIHYGWNKAFKYLGYDTYWFSDNNYPIGFDFNECLFLTEGWADSNIPICKSSIYIVNDCRNPGKYYDQVKRLIDMRYLVDEIRDVNYSYVLEKGKVEKISDSLYYEKLKDNGGARDFHDSPEPMNYEAIYTCWATDLLPQEINFEDRFFNRESNIYWFGSATPGNTYELRLFASECEKNGIKFIVNNPWHSPQSFDTVKEMTKRSFMSPDIRTGGDPNKIAQGETGTCHKKIGYIACRLFKSVSYGQLGITNSKHMFDIMSNTVIYNDNETQLFHDALAKLKDFNLIEEQMNIVKNSHTFVTRINDVIKILA